MLAENTESSFSFKGGPSLDTVVKISNFKLPDHPVKNRRVFDSRVGHLFDALVEIPDSTITCTGFTTGHEKVDLETQQLEVWLENSESILTLLQGTSFKLIKQQVRYFLPQKSSTFLKAANKAEQKLIELREKLRFVLDEPTENEWLPTPAVAGTFGKCDAPITFEEL